MIPKEFFDISIGFRFSKLHFGSVPSIPVAVLVYYYWAWYTYFRNGRYIEVAQGIISHDVRQGVVVLNWDSIENTWLYCNVTDNAVLVRLDI